MAVLKIIEKEITEHYSDGDQVESEILEYVRNNPSGDYSDVLAQDQRWPVFYHLTDMREGILNWYDFTPGCDILEIGAGMGALTGLLCRNAGTVTSVELTLPRARVIEERCRQFDNLTILVGNFNRMAFTQQFDYITLIGVLEYAPGFTDDGNPATFLKRIRKLLKPGGKLLIAIENRFGLKYWCGAAEDHIGKPYAGINGYYEDSPVCTYSRSDLTKLLSSCGLESARFYYPLPDYKLPQILFSDEYLPKSRLKGKVRNYYTDDPILLTDEREALNEVIDNNVFPFFANSFFVEVSEKESKNNQPIFATFTAERLPEEQVITKIYSEGVVKKEAASQKALLHLDEIIDIQKAFKSPSLVPYKREGKDLIMPFIDGDALEDILIDAIYRNAENEVEQWINLFYDELLRSSEYEIINGEPVLKTGFVEMNFQNCLVRNNSLIFFDQEWIEKDVPASAILYRAIRTLYVEHPYIENYLSKSELLKQYCRGVDLIREEQFEIEFAGRVLRKKGNPVFLLDTYRGTLHKEVLTDYRIIERQLKERTIILEETQKVMNETGKQLAERTAELDLVRQTLSEKEQYILDVQNSFSWKITRPLYHSKAAVSALMAEHTTTKKIYKAMSILRRKGIKELGRSYKRYRQGQKELEGAAIILRESPDQIASSNNKDGYLPYDAEYQYNVVFSGLTTDVKMLAFYLPQFHVIPENNAWWGEGFTEWNNVRKGEAMFPGHYQPRVPHADIGYYFLDDIDVMRRQAELAKQHGIYGFCFYYYWFSGKRLLEKPVDMLLQHPEIDLPFCLCWANENWTRAWDGMNKNVLIAQEYSDDDDERFIVDLKKYIDDQRYIRIHGKPLVMVYNPGQIPDCRKSFSKWRETAKKIGLGEILIWTCQTANNTAQILHIEDCIDAEVEFPPHNMWLESFAVRDVELNGKSAFLYNYQRLVSYIERKLKNEEKTLVPIHHSCMLAWDNAARRKDGWFTYYAFSLYSLYRWVLAIADRARKDFDEESRFVFINAWNEWGEGTYLEPDEKYGYANINTVSKALFNLPFQYDLKVISEKSPFVSSEQFNSAASFESTKPRIAVQLHMFYLDTLDETIENLNCMPFEFDCYVSTDTLDKKKKIKEKMAMRCRAKYKEVTVYPNRGRDVAPLLVQMAPVLDEYDYLCHIHSKKTKTNDHGNEWRKYNFRHLFGSSEYMQRLFRLFEDDETLGIIMPEIYPVLELQAEWGGNKEGVQSLLDRIGCSQDLPANPVFPVGNMFWARTKAVKKLFEAGLTQKDFPEEAGQVNATIAHQIERSWVYIAQSAGFRYCKTFNNCNVHASIPARKRLGIYMHYDAAQVISKEDVETIQYFSGMITDLMFVSNSALGQVELNKIRPFVRKTFIRDNIGFDFGGWRQVLLALGKEAVSQYDELVLLNNSFFKPVYDLGEVFSDMGKKELDFWGITVFPYSPDGSYIHKDCIPEHLQSYFLVFENTVLQSAAFWDFWQNLKDYTDFIDVVGNCESQFTKILSDAGFTYEPYIRETYYLSRFLNNYAIPYEKPTSLLLLRDPFVKKKCYDYMSDDEKRKLEWLTGKLKE